MSDAKFYGLDLASGPDLSAVTLSGSHGLQAGDRVTLSGYSNRFRHFVGNVTSVNTASLRAHERPSRGYARHVRRRKAQTRKA